MAEAEQTLRPALNLIFYHWFALSSSSANLWNERSRWMSPKSAFTSGPSFSRRSFLNQLMLWRSGMFSRLLHGRSWVRNQVRVDECKFILFSFGKVGSFKGKKLKIFFVPILKRDFVWSQSAFRQGINTSEILKINPIQNWTALHWTDLNWKHCCSVYN